MCGQNVVFVRSTTVSPIQNTAICPDPLSRFSTRNTLVFVGQMTWTDGILKQCMEENVCGGERLICGPRLRVNATRFGLYS